MGKQIFMATAGATKNIIHREKQKRRDKQTEKVSTK